MDDNAWILVTLRSWLDHQLQERGPKQRALEAAVANNDPAEVRQLFEDVPFTAGQRRYFEDLLRRWERTIEPE
ncbi:MAG: hypothetical protein V3V06_02305 [Dehalococcoidia bacterium]